MTWSYSTGSDTWTTGAMSDTFVVPNLNVFYEEVQKVQWDNKRCSVKEVTIDGKTKLPEATSFNIKAETSQPALSFYTRYHVENVKLPELKKTMGNKNQRYVDCDCSKKDGKKKCIAFGNEKPSTCSEYEKQIGYLTIAIDAWTATLEEDNIDKSKSINNWFEEVGKDLMNDTNDLAVEGYSSALVSDTLLSNKGKIEGGQCSKRA